MVMAILIFVLGGSSVATMSTAILPDINIPVASVIWTYTNIAPGDMEKRIVSAQNLILPAGTIKIDRREYRVQLNSSPDVISTVNTLPVKVL